MDAQQIPPNDLPESPESLPPPEELKPTLWQALRGPLREIIETIFITIAIFLFAVLILVFILGTYTRAGIEVVGPVAAFGLGIVWLEGWRRERQLFKRFYQEELDLMTRLEQESKDTVRAAFKGTLEETIEQQVQKALRQRWQR